VQTNVFQPSFRGTPFRVPREIIKLFNKNFKIPLKIPNIARNITGIFVHQLEIIEQIRDTLI